MSTTETADAPTWDLTHLIDLESAGLEAPAGGEAPDGAAAVNLLLDEAQRRAEAFQAEHEGKVGELDGPGLLAAMQELAAISELAGRALNYAHLSFAGDTADPEIGALLQSSSERATQLNTSLLFFELEWVAIDDERADELLATEGLDFCRHHLELERRYRDHLLTAPEERIASELSVTGGGAWSRLFDELTSAIRVELPGADEPVTLDQALSGLFNPDRDERRKTAEAVTEALQPSLRTRAYVFNTLLQEKSIKDRLRSYPHWLATRNLSNEASDESVQALVEAVKARYELPRRWYRTKAKLLGIDKLADYDRMAVVSSDDAEIGWEEGRGIVLDTFGDVSPVMKDIAERFMTEAWIDVPPRESKRGGAFSASTVPGVHPYVMLNWTDRRRDVTTLAHELGHGIHQYLARDQGVFHQSTPLTVAETASVFAEELVFGRLLAATTEPGPRLGLLAEAIEGQIATVFRQIAMNQFEDARPHRAPRARRDLGRALRRALGREPDRPARRRRRDHRRLPLLVELRAPLHRLARLRLRLRLRAAAGAQRLPPLHRARPGDRPRLPRDAQRGRLPQPRGARRAGRRRPPRPRLLGQRPRPRRGAAGRGRGGGRSSPGRALSRPGAPARRRSCLDALRKRVTVQFHPQSGGRKCNDYRWCPCATSAPHAMDQRDELSSGLTARAKAPSRHGCEARGSGSSLCPREDRTSKVRA